MDIQMVLNLAFGLISFLGGWLLKTIYAQINDLKSDHDHLHAQSRDDFRKLSQDMHEIALALPEKYVAKQDLDKLIDYFNGRFDKLEHKIDSLKS